MGSGLGKPPGGFVLECGYRCAFRYTHDSGRGVVYSRATYKTKSGTQSYQIPVELAVSLSLTESVPTQATVGQPYSFNLSPLLTVAGDSAYNGSGVTWTTVSNALPAGLSFNASTGVVSGTASAEGSGSLVVNASYKGATSANVSYPFSVVTTDPYYSSVTYLLHLDGNSVNQKSGGGAPTDVGMAYAVTNAKFSQSAQFTNGQNTYIKLPDNAMAFGTGDFTIEFWARGNGANTFIFDGTQGPRITFRFGATGTLGYLVANTTLGNFSPGSPSTWTHYAVSRVNGTDYFFTNGVLNGTAADANNYVAGTNTNRIGHYQVDNQYNQYTYNGMLDDFRITKGFGRYTASFSVPTAAFPNQ